jgi:long-chain acyl-CoA synthetase
MKLSDEGEILVRGPNVFAGYWGGEPQGEWLATGDLGEVDDDGNWRVLGRRKNLLVLAGGHNVAPEPLELALRLAIPGATQVVVVGDGRKHLAALVAGATDTGAIDRAVAALNEGLPHYKQVRATRRVDAAWTPESGLLTANGKLRRAAIHEHFAREIEEMYR